jgi:hypothetical protein
MVGTAVKLALLVGVVALLGVALFRPATLFGTDGEALANSLGGEVHHAEATCVGRGAGHWRCVLSGGVVAGVEFVVTTDSYGCWNGSRVAMPKGDSPVEGSVSGCIGLADLFGA